MLCKGFFTDSKLTRSEGIQNNDNPSFLILSLSSMDYTTNLSLGLTFNITALPVLILIGIEIC